MVGDLDGVQGLIQSGAKLCPQTHEGSTPLHFAALHNQSDIALFLLKSGADPYVTDGQVFLCPACCDPVLMTRNGCSYKRLQMPLLTEWGRGGHPFGWHRP